MTNNNVAINSTYDTNLWLQTKTDPAPFFDQCIVSDELRWSLQTVVQPLQAGAQMVAAVHGTFSTGTQHLKQAVIDTLSAKNISPDVMQSIESGIANIQVATQQIQQTVNRVNKLVLSEMPTPILRHYVSVIASMHPAILQYLKDNPSKYPYFKPVSETIGLNYTIVADIADTNMLSWGQLNAIRHQTMAAPGSMRMANFNKLFAEIGDIVEVAHSACNSKLICNSGMNAYGKAFENGEIGTAHGLNYCNDFAHSARAKAAKVAIFNQLVSKFKDQMRLLDQLIPVNSNVTIENVAYRTDISGLSTIVDQLGNKVLSNEPSTDTLIPYEQQTLKETMW